MRIEVTRRSPKGVLFPLTYSVRRSLGGIKRRWEALVRIQIHDNESFTIIPLKSNPEGTQLFEKAVIRARTKIPILVQKLRERPLAKKLIFGTYRFDFKLK